MTLNPKYTVHGSRHHHFGWDNSITPVQVVAPGDVVEFETVDSSGGQLNAQSSAEDVAKLDFARANPVAGPVYVDGAESGDALKVTILSFTPSGWGWTAVVPGFGLLSDQFPEPAIHQWTYDSASLQPAVYGPGGRVPLKPFCGTIGLAPGTGRRASRSRTILRPPQWHSLSPPLTRSTLHVRASFLVG